MRKIFIFLLLVFAVTACKNRANVLLTKANTAPDHDINIPKELFNSDINILFVGNSLTYTNDLPNLVKLKAQAQGIKVGTKIIASPNYAIVDHWANGEVQKYIQSKTFNYVIIQQGPSSQQEGRSMLIDGGKLYSDICNENSAKLCYFMVWPSLAYYHTFDGVIKNHKEAAAINNALLCPVGKIWKTHFDQTGEFNYYSPDGFHPSLLGSQVAADVIVQTLFP